jgi:hypothetical protein
VSDGRRVAGVAEDEQFPAGAGGLQLRRVAVDRVPSGHLRRYLDSSSRLLRWWVQPGSVIATTAIMSSATATILNYTGIAETLKIHRIRERQGFSAVYQTLK